MLLRHRGMISILTRRSISPSVSRPKQRIQLQALVLLAAFCAGLVGMVVAGGPASAHATFVSSTTVAVGTDVSFTLDVPHERAEDVFNTVVRIKVPDGWRGISCDPFPTWTCTAGPGEIDFIKDSGAEQAQDETFRFVARANDTGQVAFPVVQIYSTGENVLWQDTAIVMADGGDPPITEVPAVPTTRGDDSGPAGAPFSPAVADEDPVVVGSAGGSDHNRIFICNSRGKRCSCGSRIISTGRRNSWHLGDRRISAVRHHDGGVLPQNVFTGAVDLDNGKRNLTGVVGAGNKPKCLILRLLRTGVLDEVDLAGARSACPCRERIAGDSSPTIGNLDPDHGVEDVLCSLMGDIEGE